MGVVVSGHQYFSQGNQVAVSGRLAFDSAYQKQGEDLAAKALGLGIVNRIEIQEQHGYLFSYDALLSKLHVKRPGAFVQVEATGTFTAGTAYQLHQRPAYILGIRGTAGSTGSKRLIPTGETLGANQCSVNFATGVITWGDAAITAAVIMYVPLGLPGFTSDLLVVDELVTLVDATGGQGRGTLASRAACINYVWNNEDNEVLTIIPVAEVPGANECDIDILNTADTTIDVLTSDIGNGAAKLKATYIKYNASVHGRLLRFIDQADMTVTSNVLGPNTGASAASTPLDSPALVLPGFGQNVVGEATATNVFATFVDPDAASAAGLVLLDFWRNVWTGHSNEGFTTIELPLLLIPSGLAGGVVVDVPFGEDLSHLTGIAYTAWGS
jgi:hypothetical protein